MIERRKWRYDLPTTVIRCEIQFIIDWETFQYRQPHIQAVRQPDGRLVAAREPCTYDWPTSQLQYSPSRVTSLEQLSVAEFSGE